MKRLFSSWQGLLAGIVAIALYFTAPSIIRHFDPTAGVFDAGFLHWIILATVAYLWGVFIVWIGWQIAFRSMDKWADAHLRKAFEDLPDFIKFVAVQLSFAFMAILWFVALKLSPL